LSESHIDNNFIYMFIYAGVAVEEKLCKADCCLYDVWISSAF